MGAAMIEVASFELLQLVWLVAKKGFDWADWQGQRFGEPCAKTEPLWVGKGYNAWRIKLSLLGLLSDLEVEFVSVSINSDRVWQCQRKGGIRTTNDWHWSLCGHHSSESACPPLANGVSVVSISEDDVDSFAVCSLREPGINSCFPSSIFI